MSLLFDRVVIVEAGRRDELTVEQFLQLPLDRRIQLVMTRSLEFYAGIQPVEQKAALSSLRRLST
jgi:hypothetical protein